MFSCVCIADYSGRVKYQSFYQVHPAKLSMTWSNKTTLKFIELVKNEPCIWSPRNSGSSTLTNEAWAKILVNKNFTTYSAKDLKAKWSYLVTTYKKRLETGATSWFAFEMMHGFLGAGSREGTPIQQSRDSSSTRSNDERSFPQISDIPSGSHSFPVLETRGLQVTEDVDDRLRVELMNKIGNLVHDYTVAIKKRRI
nr:unnamed protein product [Callosobruchus chinensis]